MPSPSELDTQVRYRMLERMAATQQMLRQTLGLLSEIVFRCDAQGVLTYVNPAWEQTLHHPIDASLNRRISEFMSPEDADDWQDLTEQEDLFAHDNVQVALRTKEDHEIHFRLSLRKSPEDDYVGSLHNITERVLAERAKEERDRLKDEFLANISHELRTPLNAMLNIPSSLLEDFVTQDVAVCPHCHEEFSSEDDAPLEEADLAGPCPACGHEGPLTKTQATVLDGEAEHHRHLLTVARQAANHLLGVVTDLLDFSQLDAPQFKLHPGELEVAALLEDVRNTLEASPRDKPITVEYRLDDPALMMTGDKVKVAQILINIIGNALKFAPPNSTVTVTAALHTEDHTVRFCIADEGPGIAPEFHEKIFDSFTQVDGSQTRKHGGTGLGLAIAHKLAELHRGHIELESTVGVGSTFTVVLPQSPSTPPARAEVPAENGPKNAILVVDDDHVHLEMAKSLLERKGFTAALVSDSERAISTAKTLAPQAIMLDIMMPKASGLSILKALKSDPDTRQIPVVVVTAYHSHEAAVKKLGAYWLPKPWTPERLSEMLTRITAIETIAPAD